MTSEAARVHIIGIGDDGTEGLTEGARQLLAQADLVVGSDHASTESVTGASEAITCSDLDSLVDLVNKNEERRIVVLTSGDPLFYGVARYLCDKLGKDRFEVLPNVSSMQLAFARVKESWDDAFLVNLATQPLDQVVEKARVAEKVGLFTTDQVSPSLVAQQLIDRKIDYFTAYVCENLGSPDERVTHGSLSDLAHQSFSPPNVMILVRRPMVPDRPAEMAGKRLFGNRDDMFLQSLPKRGLLTPMEVRVIALAELDIGPASIVWDVGAGSGAVAVEAAQMIQSGKVYAIEMEAQDHELLLANTERFGVSSTLQPVHGQAPEAWADLPSPDAIFVGGTGRAVGRIVELALKRLKKNGRLVANVGSVDNISAVYSAMSNVDGDTNVRMIQVAHGNDQMDRLRFESMNPTFLISFVKN